MRALQSFGVLFLLAILIASAHADSIQLRNGRHVQGKYLGGTATMIGFMTDRSVEYFATSDVLVVVFENSSDSPMSAQPNSMQEGSTPDFTGTPRKIHGKAERSKAQIKRVSASTPVIANQ